MKVQEANSYKLQLRVEGKMNGERYFEQKEQHVQRHRSLGEQKLPTTFSMIRAQGTGTRLRRALYDAIDFKHCLWGSTDRFFSSKLLTQLDLLFRNIVKPQCGRPIRGVWFVGAFVCLFCFVLHVGI